MKAITIRGLDPEVAEKLKESAYLQNKSVNRFLLEMINKELGFENEQKHSKRYNDLDELFGKWSEEEFQKISDKIDQNRQIDSELWS